MKQKILLHACCAPCTAGVYHQLKDEFDVVLFWYNPNIFPKEEHNRRLQELLDFAERENIKLLVGDYDWQEEHNFWLSNIKGLKNEPERGKRCEVCYKTRLAATANVAAESNKHHHEYDYFGAELSISPHKNTETINEVGEKIGEKYKISFYVADFKKADGYKVGCEISKKNNLYRQDYCGCEFSVRN